jgi:hypothetical protein
MTIGERLQGLLEWQAIGRHMQSTALPVQYRGMSLLDYIAQVSMYLQRQHSFSPRVARQMCVRQHTFIAIRWSHNRLVEVTAEVISIRENET